jgi:hypothetical protein
MDLNICEGYRYRSVAPGLAADAFLIDITWRVGGGGVEVFDSSLIDFTKPDDSEGADICLYGLGDAVLDVKETQISQFLKKMKKICNYLQMITSTTYKIKGRRV